MREIDDLAYNCTKIIISHKIGPLINCNKFYLFEKGRIISFSSLEELKKIISYNEKNNLFKFNR